MKYKTLKVDIHSDIGYLSLNRPKVHNAINGEMIIEFLDALNQLKETQIRVLILQGEGNSFCSGADVNYMKALGEMDETQNIHEAKKLAELLYNLYYFPKPTIAIAKGNVYGGGIGVLGCCDFSFCTTNTVFAFSEIKLGLIPSVISPYIIRRIGVSKTKELFLSGRKFDSFEAEKIGLVTKALNEKDLEQEVQLLISELFKTAPNVVIEVKMLIEENLRNLDLQTIQEYTSSLLAKIRKGEEAKEGLKSFLEKKKPNWYKEPK
ncbi:MAG: enoyl-CoA hydratase-related protein [Leptonema sp. (in: bacteria)]